jgi:hypothetical protein
MYAFPPARSVGTFMVYMNWMGGTTASVAAPSVSVTTNCAFRNQFQIIAGGGYAGSCTSPLTTTATTSRCVSTSIIDLTGTDATITWTVLTTIPTTSVCNIIVTQLNPNMSHTLSMEMDLICQLLKRLGVKAPKKETLRSILGENSILEKIPEVGSLELEWQDEDLIQTTK